MAETDKDSTEKPRRQGHDETQSLQGILTALGYAVSDRSGEFSDSTTHAIKLFQHRHLNAEPTGELNAATDEALRAAYGHMLDGAAKGSLPLIGRVVGRRHRAGIPNITVKVFDSDIFTSDDYLGEATTDKQGWFRLTIDLAHAHEPRPDLYFVLVRAGKEVGSTRKTPLLSYRKGSSPIVLDLDLARPRAEDHRPAHAILDLQRQLTKREVLGEHATGFLDEETARAYGHHQEKLQPDFSKPGSSKLALQLVHKSSKAPLRGRLVRVAPIDSEYLKADAQTLVVDSFGRFSFPITIKKTLPPEYEARLTLSVRDSAKPQHEPLSITYGLSFDSALQVIEAESESSAPAETCVGIASAPVQSATELYIDGVKFEALPTDANDGESVPLKVFHDSSFSEDGDKSLWINLFKYARNDDVAARITFPESAFESGPSSVTITAVGKYGAVTFNAYDAAGNALDTQVHSDGITAAEHKLSGSEIRAIEVVGALVGVLKLCYEGSPSAWLPSIAEQAAGAAASAPCECDPCVSALSPSAYYVDLFGFAAKTFGTDTVWLEERLRQSLSTVVLDCEAAEERKSYLGFVNDVLIRFVAERRNIDWRHLTDDDIDAICSKFRGLPTGVLDLFDWVMDHRGWNWQIVTSERLDAIYAEFSGYVLEAGLTPDVVFQAFSDVLRELGTTTGGVAAASSAQAKQELVDALGLHIADFAYLAKQDSEVVFSDLARGFDLIERSRETLLFQSYRDNLKQELYQKKLQELLALMDEQATGAPANEAQAASDAEQFAETETTNAESELTARAQADAREQASQSRERIESSYLAAIRTNLLFIGHNEARRNHYGLPTIDTSGLLGDYLCIDVSAGICKKTTYIGFLIEVLQSLIASFKAGHEDFAPLVAKLDRSRWVWMRSYGLWHAIQSIFLYTSNFVFPGVRRIDTGWNGRGWSSFFQAMTELLDQQPRLNLASAQEALDLLAAKLRHLEGVEVSHIVEAEDQLYLFCSHAGANGSALYYSSLDRNGGWSGWESLDLLGHELRKSRVDGRCIQDVVVLDGRVYVLFLVREASQAMYAALGEHGLVVPPTPLADRYIDTVRAVVLRPRTVPRSDVPEGRIFAFYPNPEVISATAPGSYTFQQYLVTTVGEDGAEELGGAGLEIPAGATLVSVASLSGLSSRTADDVLRNVHMVWQPGVTVYSPVFFAVKTGADHLVVYARQHADDLLWDSFHTTPRIVNLPYDDNFAWGPHLSADAPDMGAVTATLLPRWVASPAAQIGTSFECWLFDGANAIHKLNANLVEVHPSINIYPPGQKQTVDSASLFGSRVVLHNNGYLVERDNSGSLSTTGQVVLGKPDFLFPLEVNLLRRKGAIGTGAEPVETDDGRQQLKTVQARKFSHFTTSGYAKEYLAELFLHAPLYVANLLNEEERFEDAWSVLSVVFQPFVTAQEHVADREHVQSMIDLYWPGEAATAPETHSHRFIYYGFFQKDDSDPHLDYRGDPEFLDSPVNPHSLADHRPLTYARAAVRDTIENLLDWADAEFSMDAPESVPRARELYEDVGEILAFDDLPKDLCASGHAELVLPAPMSAKTADITRGFCIPSDPIYASFSFRVQSNLEKIRTCRNIAGVKRALPSYAAAVDPTALVEAVAAGAELDDFIPAQPPPLYRYSVLYSRAKELAQTAIQYEAHFLSVLEKYDSAAYTLEKARNDLRLANEDVSLRGLHVTRANQSVRRAELQLERVEIGHDYYDALVAEGHSDLEQAMIGTMIGLAASQAAVGVGGAIAGGYALTIQMGLAATQTTISILQTYAAFERREQEWRHQLDLASKDIDIADQGILIANTELDIAAKERSIAELRSQFARDAVEFLAVKQFASAELYSWMKKELRKLYRKQLNIALGAARTAQQALAFELQEPLNFVGHQYGDVRREDLLGAEKLTLDLDKLEQHRFTQAERRREITTELSLAANMPGEFARFRQTGVLEFATAGDLFDRHYPGHYQRLLKSVEVSVVALIPPASGIHATLSNHGVSRVMTGPPFAEASIIQRPPESVSLSSPSNGSGLFELQLQDPMLLPFEGCGVDTSWTFEMPPATNPFNFETIMDVRLRLRYTARHDAGYRDKVVARLRKEYSNTLAASARASYPDSWYDFHNPRFGSGTAPYTIVMPILAERFPPNERAMKAKRIIVAAAMSPNIEVPVNVRFEPADGSAPVVANGEKLVDGMVTLNHFLNKTPFGTWVVEFDTAADPNLFTEFFGANPPTQLDGNTVIDTSRYHDVLLVIEYGAELRF